MKQELCNEGLGNRLSEWIHAICPEPTVGCSQLVWLSVCVYVTTTFVTDQLESTTVSLMAFYWTVQEVLKS